MSGPPYTAVDVHAHHLGPGLPELPEVPRLVVNGGAARIVDGRGGARPAPTALWDVPTRLGEMDRVGLSHQVISPVPEVMERAWTADPAYARAVNDQIAQACRESGGRLLGLGCLHRADPRVELERCLALGLRGVETGTRLAGHELDAERTAGLWAACADAGAAVLVHPVGRGHGVLCRTGVPLEIGLGMPTDAAAPAFALVAGGVLDRHSDIRVALTHGGGAFPWVEPRLRSAAGGDERWDAAVRRLFVDTLVQDPALLPVLAHRFGADRLLVGSDSPFMPDYLLDAVRSVDALPDGSRRAAQVDNALDFLGLRPR
ncbi:amidohydrolase family protein [Pseudonocardia halophobica]|uniref:2-amino-3-carboxymuconate-6-semialdehyde decarboxylase n=1 Tax=Pseudonocardia halophobica TaxID=29401 RepID=A0A9W6L724_9PSEU|nr:amidohydrolase family protein [Pseudonocardia halophobica]GLL12249.1 amidohydrolase [Pseudonocardia halophobica]